MLRMMSHPPGAEQQSSAPASVQLGDERPREVEPGMLLLGRLPPGYCLRSRRRGGAGAGGGVEQEQEEPALARHRLERKGPSAT